MGKIIVNGLEVAVKGRENITYISLTDLARAKNPEAPADVVKNWMRTNFAITFMGLWESMYNPNAKLVEIDQFASKSGENSFTMSPQKWIEATNAIGIVSKAGNNGGTFAHPDIAFEFTSWISAEFKLYLIKEFQRMKVKEQEQLAWDAKRELARINYRLQTDAVKENLILPTLTPSQTSFVYADEGDLLNVVLFGKTAKEWRVENKAEAERGENMRDYATLHQLLVLANLESHNAAFINEKMPQRERIEKLRGIAERELRILIQHASDARLLLAIGDITKNKKDDK